jgi:hypothetical protein
VRALAGEPPYYQFFCGELSFCHKLPFDRSSMTHWRQRLGEEQLVALIQESLSVAHKTGALATRDLERVVVDTTVQPKANRPSDRRAAVPSGVGKARRPGATPRCAAATELSAGGLRLPPSPVLDSEPRLRCREYGARGKAVVSIKGAAG